MVVVNSKEELEELISQRIGQCGPKCDLNDIDVSKVTDMSYLFYRSKFNGDISKWDVSNVRDMFYMFSDSKFDGDLSKWDVSSVKDMGFMFSNSSLNSKRPYWYDPKRTEL